MPYVPEPCIHFEHPISNQKTLAIAYQHPKKFATAYKCNNYSATAGEMGTRHKTNANPVFELSGMFKSPADLLIIADGAV